MTNSRERNQSVVIEEHPHLEDEDDPKEEEFSPLGLRVLAWQNTLKEWVCNYKVQLKFALYCILIILYACYFGYAMYYSFHKNIGLLALTLLVLSGALFQSTKDFIGKVLERMHFAMGERMRKYGKWLVYITLQLEFLQMHL